MRSVINGLYRFDDVFDKNIHLFIITVIDITVNRCHFITMDGHSPDDFSLQPDSNTVVYTFRAKNQGRWATITLPRHLDLSGLSNRGGASSCRRREGICMPKDDQTEAPPSRIDGQTGASDHIEDYAEAYFDGFDFGLDKSNESDERGSFE